MKKIYHLLFLCFGGGVFGQANFFDVPSGDTIGYGHLYFQQQVSLDADELQFSTLATFGLGRGFEAGLNLHQLTFDQKDKCILTSGEDASKLPDLMFNAQKIFKLNSWYRLGLGTRIGLNYSSEIKSSTPTHFTYLNHRMSLRQTKFALTAGTWLANRNYSGVDNCWGIMAGLQAPLIGNFMLMQADFISGKNALSYFNAGLNMWLFGWRLSAGAGLPMPHSGNTFHWLLQLSTD